MCGKYLRVYGYLLQWYFYRASPSQGGIRGRLQPLAPTSQGYENSFLADAFLAKQSKFWQPQYLDILSKILEQLCSVEKGGVSHVTKYQ